MIPKPINRHSTPKKDTMGIFTLTDPRAISPHPNIIRKTTLEIQTSLKIDCAINNKAKAVIASPHPI